ncbi:MAG TPA: lipopolysaccharide heptosyltransferase I [Sutterella sp.]|nr:lipopolysaccharide heptosyltransferase I [Sutterella sp.]
MRKILIVKTTSMGDLVHALPAACDIARHMPEAQIHWLSESSFADIPRLCSAVTAVHEVALRKWKHAPFSSETRQAVARVRDELEAARFDTVIDLQGLVKSAWVARWAKAPVYGYDRRSIREPLASFFYSKTFAVSRQMHAIERCRRLAALACQFPFEEKPLDFGIKLAKSATQTVYFMPSTSQARKLWAEDAWVKLGQRLAAEGYDVRVLWGSVPERERAERIARAIGTNATLNPKMSLRELADAFAASSGVFALDTGLLHLAAALAIPAIGIYTDSKPLLLGVVGEKVATVGGKDTIPDVDTVWDAFRRLACR